MTTERSPSPWELVSKGWDGQFIYANDERVGRDHRRLIADVSLMYDGAEANAAFIVRACNAHDDLVNTLKELDAMGGLGSTVHEFISAAIVKATK